jgi:hypothetical protein
MTISVNMNYVVVRRCGRLFVSMPMDSYCVTHTALFKQGIISPDPSFTAARLRKAWARWFRINHPEAVDLINNLEAPGEFLDLEVYNYFPEMYGVAVKMDHIETIGGSEVYTTAEEAGEIYGRDLPDWEQKVWHLLYDHELEHMYVSIMANEAPQGLILKKNKLKLIGDEEFINFTIDVQSCVGPMVEGQPVEGMVLRELLVEHWNQGRIVEIVERIDAGEYRDKVRQATAGGEEEDLPVEAEPKRPRPNSVNDEALAIEGYAMHWPRVIGRFAPGPSSLLERMSNPTICIHCLVCLPHAHTTEQRNLGLVEPNEYVRRAREPRNQMLRLEFDEACVSNPLLLEADYVEINSIWYQAIDPSEDPESRLEDYRQYFRTQWRDYMTDEQKRLYLLSRRARPLVLRARAEPSWWPKDEDDKSGPAVLVAGGTRFGGSSSSMVQENAEEKNHIEKDKELTKIDQNEFLPCFTPLIKEEKRVWNTHHDGLTPLLPVSRLNLSSPDAEKLRSAGGTTVSKVVTPVSSVVLLIFQR